MKYNKVKNTILTVFVVFTSLLLFAQESGKSSGGAPLVSSIKKDFETYKGREITLVLRLQYVNYITKVISFYDEENVNLHFDISDYAEIPALQRSLRHTSRGLLFRVRCSLRSIDDDGFIIADLIEYSPYRLEKLP